MTVKPARPTKRQSAMVSVIPVPPSSSAVTERWYLQDMIVARNNGPELLSDTFPTDDILEIS